MVTRRPDQGRRMIVIIALILGMALLVGGFVLWVLYQAFPAWFPGWLSLLFAVLAGLGALITIFGSALSDIALPLWDRLRRGKHPSLRQLSERAPIRQVNYDALIERLGRSGRIPWIDRNTTSAGLLRTYGRVAIVGRMKSGKTREAAELIRAALEDGWISLVYEPTAALDLIDQDALAQAVAAEVDERQRCLFFIDQLDLRAEPERLQRLSICVQTISRVRPDTYFLITIQRERLTSKLRAWLEERGFHHVILPPLTPAQRSELAGTAAKVLSIEITDDAISSLASQTDGRPYRIIFVLQQVRPEESLTATRVKELLARDDEESWAEQRRLIVETCLAAKPLLDSISVFMSAGVTPRESSIRRYAHYLMSPRIPPRKTSPLLDDAAERWTAFDIVATKGLYSIPEPLLLPLLVDTLEARAQLAAFVDHYHPGLLTSLAETLLHPLDALFRGRGLHLWRLRFVIKIRTALRRVAHALRLKRLRSRIKSWLDALTGRRPQFWNIRLRLMAWLAESLFAWPADRALLQLELGNESKRTGYLPSVALTGRGRRAYLDKEYPKALDYFEKALALNANNAQALCWRGLTFRITGRHEEALADFDRAIEIDPDDGWAIAHRGVTYCLVSRYEEALADFNRAIELDPNRAWAIANRGVTYRLMNRYEEALADLNRAIEIDPDDAWAIANRGVTYRLMKRYEEALADFNRAIELEPKLTEVIAHRGVTYGMMKRYEEALADFNQAVELDSNVAWTIACRGMSYRLMKRYEEALADFNRAIELEPKVAGVIAERGLTYRLMKRCEEALADFNRAIELDPKVAGVIAERGLTYRLMKRYEEALADFNRAIELEPKLAWAIATRGRTHRLMEQYDKAMADFDRAIELDADADWCIYNRAVLCQFLGRTEQAVADLAAAIECASKRYETAPQDWENTLNLALYHLVAEDTAEASRLYGEALAGGATPAQLRAGAQDLDDLLALFPAHSQAQTMRDVLQKHLEEAHT